MADGISIREFARREHVSDTLVHQTLKQGRLTKRPDGLMAPSLIGIGCRASKSAKPTAKVPLQSGEGPLHIGSAATGLVYCNVLRLKYTAPECCSVEALIGLAWVDHRALSSERPILS